MKILFIGDIYGERAVQLLERELSTIKKENQINLVIANGENACEGRGLNKDLYTRLMKAGVHLITLGNHAFSKREIKDFMDDANIVRPANLTTNHGVGYKEINYNGKKIKVVNLQGRIYSDVCLDCPFKTMDDILKNTTADYYIVDFHADATSEKIAFATDFKDKLTAVIGTHTHVQTADERLIGSMLYITDVGMTGPLNGILGSNSDAIIKRFRSGIYYPAEPQKGTLQLNAVILDINEIQNKIKRIHLEF